MPGGQGKGRVQDNLSEFFMRKQMDIDTWREKTYGEIG